MQETTRLGEEGRPWSMYIDCSFAPEGSEACVHIINPRDDIKYAIQPDLRPYWHGLCFTQDIGARSLQIFSDSQLITVQQVIEEFEIGD